MSTEKDPERRAPVQAWGCAHLDENHPHREKGAKPSGTISWEEHEEVWAAYDKMWRTGQSAERMAQRGGFGYREATELVGHELKTWQPRK